MPNPKWLDRVRLALLRAGLPTDYAARLTAELADHAAELEEHSPGEPAERMLGPAEEVAREAVRAYRAGSFAGRFPVLAFVLAPLFVLEFAFLAYLHAAIQVVEGLGGMGSASAVALSHVLTWLSGFVVPGATLGLLWRLFRRCGRPRTWFAAAGLIVTAWAGLYFARFVPPTADAEADLITALCFGESWLQLFQFAAAGGLVLWLIARSDDRPRPLVVC